MRRKILIRILCAPNKSVYMKDLMCIIQLQC